MASAAKLLEERSYREISVLEIVSESKVNRNTFYYHFRDLPALVEELGRRSIDRVLSNPTFSALGCISRMLELICENKKSLLHVYGSADRELFDQGLDKLCSYFVEGFSDRYMRDLSAENRGILLRLKKDFCFGFMSDWLGKGLRREELPELTAMAELTLRLLK